MDVDRSSQGSGFLENGIDSLHVHDMKAAEWERLRPFELLLMDDNRGRNAAVITAQVTIGGELSASWVVRHMAEPLATHPRFRSVVRASWRRFDIDPLFKADKHVTFKATRLTSELLDELLCTPLDPEVSSWQLYAFADPGASYTDVVVRVHHCVGDGVGLLNFVLEVISPKAAHGSGQSALAPLPPKREMHDAIQAEGGKPTRMDALTQPVRDFFSTFVMMLVPDSRNVLRRAPLGSVKHGGWAKERSVRQLRVASRGLGITMNDLLLCALTSTLARYMDKPKRVTVGVAMNGHRREANNFLYNAVTFLCLALPVSQSTRRKQLARITRRMLDVKRGYLMPLAKVAFFIFATLPRPLRVRLWRHITKRISIVFSNVPGPTDRIVVGEHAIDKIRVLAPAQGSCGVTVTAISYLDTLNIGIAADVNRLPEPQAMMDIFDEELDSTLRWAEAFKEDGVPEGTPVPWSEE